MYYVYFPSSLSRHRFVGVTNELSTGNNREIYYVAAGDPSLSVDLDLQMRKNITKFKKYDKNIGTLYVPVSAAGRVRTLTLAEPT